MKIKINPINFLSINTLKMLKTDSPIVLQNINMIARRLFLLFKKSTTFWDNPRTFTICILNDPNIFTPYFNFRLTVCARNDLGRPTSNQTVSWCIPSVLRFQFFF